jgi:hypothetical protein
MYLKLKSTGDLVEILDLPALFDPFRSEVPGRTHAGEELGDPDVFGKDSLQFPSDEPLPRCWTDGKYREKALGAS